MSKGSLEKRAQRIIARQQVATMLGRENAKMQGQLNTVAGFLQSFFQRGFWGRLKWIVTGR